MKKFLITIPLLLLLTTGCSGNRNKIADGSQSLYDKKLQVGSQVLNVQMVSSAEDMAQGLSGRSRMKDDEGMLFELGQKAIPGFWMKDMKFNLDLIWISDNKVIGITKNISAPTSSDASLPLYSPPSEVNQVLEVNAGWTEKNHITIGDAVSLK